MSCDCAPVSAPTLAGFIAFVRNGMGISTTVLPDNSVWLTYAYCVALEIVNTAILEASPRLYLLAVYNLAGSNLLNYAQDLPGAAFYPPNSKSELPFFAYTRKELNLLGFVSGVIQAAADESTSESMIVPEAFKEFTLANLQQLKDAYGRAYLSIAQSYGPAAWGLT